MLSAAWSLYGDQLGMLMRSTLITLVIIAKYIYKQINNMYTQTPGVRTWQYCSIYVQKTVKKQKYVKINHTCHKNRYA